MDSAFQGEKKKKKRKPTLNLNISFGIIIAKGQIYEHNSSDITISDGEETVPG